MILTRQSTTDNVMGDADKDAQVANHDNSWMPEEIFLPKSNSKDISVRSEKKDQEHVSRPITLRKRLGRKRRLSNGFLT